MIKAQPSTKKYEMKLGKDTEKGLNTVKDLVLKIKSYSDVREIIRYLVKIIDNDKIMLLERNLFAFKVLELISEVIESLSEPAGEYRDTIDDENKFLKNYIYAKDLYQIIEVLKNVKKENPTHFRYSLLLARSKIKNDRELFSKINKIVSEDSNIEAQFKFELPILSNVGAVLEKNKKNPQKAIKELKALVPKIEPTLKNMHDEKTTGIIRQSIIKIGGGEIDALKSDIDDLKGWMSYIVENKPISFFINRVNEYVYGTRSSKGILAHFKDKRLYKQMKSNFDLLGLMTFEKKQEFIDWSYDLLTNAHLSKEWKGFLDNRRFVLFKRKGWYHNLDKYVKDMKTKYCDPKLAHLLETSKEELHEDVIRWWTRIQGVQQQLKNSDYQHEFIVKSATSLIGLFTNRINELVSEEEKEIKNLEKYIEKRMKEINKESEGIKKKLDKVIEKQKDKILTDKMKKVLLARMILNKHGVDNYLERFYKLYSKFDSGYYNRQIKSFADFNKDFAERRKVVGYMRSIMGRYKRHHAAPFFLTSYWDQWIKTLMKNEISGINAFLLFTDDPAEVIEVIEDGLNAISTLNVTLSKVRPDFKDFGIKEKQLPLRGANNG